MSDRATPAWLEGVLRALPGGITVQDESGRVVFANDVAARSCGVASADELLAMAPERFAGAFAPIDEDGRPLGPDELPGRRVIAGAPSAQAVLRYRPEPGKSERWVLLRATPLVTPDGRRFAVNAWDDVTDERLAKRSAQFLAEAGSRLVRTLDYEAMLPSIASLAVPRLADWCFIDVTEDGASFRRVAVAAADPALHDLAERSKAYPFHPETNVAAAALRGRRPVVIDPVDCAHLERMATNAEHLAILRAIGPTSAIVAPLVARERTIGVVVLISSTPTRRFGERDLAVASDLAHLVGLAVDNALLYAAAQSAVGARDEFLSIASHELRTPLTVLRLHVQNLERAFRRDPAEVARDPRLDSQLALVSRQIDRLASLVANLLDLSRIERGGLGVEPEPTDLAAVVRELSERLREPAARVGSELVVVAPPRLEATCDRVRIDQVLTNLVTNAMKYAPGTRIVVELSADAARARVRVGDGGPGIDPEVLPRIFERFERGREAGSRGGLGLGLFIAREIVQAHGGHLGVSSAPGRGTEFVVELPRSGPPDHGTEHGPAQDDPSHVASATSPD
jgi:signal transduction histidine kinase